jgi:hypothetical protein
MENQGKRPDQYESSMKIFVWTFIVFLAIVVINTIIKIIQNL